jgi:hypothetical protein
MRQAGDDMNQEDEWPQNTLGYVLTLLKGARQALSKWDGPSEGRHEIDGIKRMLEGASHSFEHCLLECLDKARAADPTISDQKISDLDQSILSLLVAANALGSYMIVVPAAQAQSTGFRSALRVERDKRQALERRVRELESQMRPADTPKTAKAGQGGSAILFCALERWKFLAYHLSGAV